MAGTFKEIALLPQTVRSEVIAVIGQENDDSVVSEIPGIESVDDSTELLIHE